MQRRTFLAGLPWVGGCLLQRPAQARARRAAQGLFLETARELLRRTPSVDLHMHPALFPLKEILNSSNPRRYRGDDIFLQRIQQMRRGGLRAGFFTLVADAPILGRTPQGPGAVRSFQPQEAWREYRRQLRVLEKLLEENGVVKVLSPEDLRLAHQQKRLAAVLACEGGDFLEGRPERVETAWKDGLRHIQLLHVAPNPLGDIQGEEARHNGLSPMGREVIREMNRLGLMVDLAHASYETARQAARISTAPLLLSHALLLDPRQPFGLGLSLDHARLIAETGGVIGVFGGAVNRNLEGYADNILRLAEAVGVDHVGLGSDLDGTGGEAVFDDYAQLPQLCALLLERGLSSEEMTKFLGQNLLRLWSQVQKATRPAPPPWQSTLRPPGEGP